MLLGFAALAMLPLEKMTAIHFIVPIIVTILAVIFLKNKFLRFKSSKDFYVSKFEKVGKFYKEIFAHKVPSLRSFEFIVKPFNDCHFRAILFRLNFIFENRLCLK